MLNKMQIKQIFNGIDVEVEINAGTNVLSGDSGTGKTLLMQALELYCAENNIKCTFLNYRQRNSTIEQIVTLCSTSDVVIMDNADLYANHELLGKLQTMSKFILISLKDLSKIDSRDITEYLVHYSNLQLRVEEV